MVKNQAKRKKVNKPTSKKYRFYKIEGDIIKRESFCPRCGPGTFLMKAKDRSYCGKCHYTEFLGQPAAKIEAKPEKSKEVKKAKK
jgi:small subunit ribosomal protein S27Ae